MARGQRRTVTLTAEQRADLVRGRDRDPRPYFRERCAAVLQVADGAVPRHVALRGLHKPRDPDTLYAWLGGYARAGLAGLVQRARGHRGFSPSAGGRTGRADAPAA